MKPSEVREMARGLGRLFECTGDCSKCWGEFVCNQVNRKDRKEYEDNFRYDGFPRDPEKLRRNGNGM